MNDILLDIVSRIKRVFKIDGESYNANRVKITNSTVGKMELLQFWKPLRMRISLLKGIDLLC